MNLSRYSKHHPGEPFFPEPEISNCPISLSIVRKETSGSEKKYFKILEFLIVR